MEPLFRKLVRQSNSLPLRAKSPKGLLVKSADLVFGSAILRYFPREGTTALLLNFDKPTNFETVAAC